MQFLLQTKQLYLWSKRSSQDVHRDSLVSIFLHRSDFCDGVIFLTADRVSQLNEAILSRIRLMLRYDKLRKEAGRRIGKRFIERVAFGIETDILGKVPPALQGPIPFPSIVISSSISAKNTRRNDRSLTLFDVMFVRTWWHPS